MDKTLVKFHSFGSVVGKIFINSENLQKSPDLLRNYLIQPFKMFFYAARNINK